MRLGVRGLVALALLSTILVSHPAPAASLIPISCTATGTSKVGSGSPATYTLNASGSCQAGLGTLYGVTVVGSAKSPVACGMSGTVSLKVKTTLSRLVPAKSYVLTERWVAHILPLHTLWPFTITQGGTTVGGGAVSRSGTACPGSSPVTIRWTRTAPDTPGVTPLVCSASGALYLKKNTGKPTFAWTIVGGGACRRIGQESYTVTFTGLDPSNVRGAYCAMEPGPGLVFDVTVKYVDQATGKAGTVNQSWVQPDLAGQGVLPYVIPFVTSRPLGAGAIVTSPLYGCWRPGRRSATFDWVQAV